MEDSTDKNRLLLEIDRTIRDLNHDLINPMIPELKLDDLIPVMAMVARARAIYLKELFDISSTIEGDVPSPDQIKSLRNLRITYDELVKGAMALETAIERGYLDVSR